MAEMAKKPNYMTVPAALRELEKIELIRKANGSYQLDNAITATQKTILSAFGLEVEDIKLGAQIIGEELQNAIITKREVEEDGENNDDEIY